MEMQYNPDGFIPKYGGYAKLISYKKAEIIFDGTYYFAHKYFHPYDRTIDQMVQAARSGKQNILEGSMASGTSKIMEIGLIKLTSFLLARQIEKLEKEFLKEGGLRERMTQARIEVRKKQNMK